MISLIQKYKNTKLLVLIIALLTISNMQAQVESGVIVNEASNGTVGAEEWIELLVIGDPANPTDPVNLTGWIIDDNNGEFEALSTGLGITTGHIILGSPFNSVSPGSLIVIYNENEPDTGELPADDPTDSNSDNVYIVPIGDASLSECGATPIANGGSPSSSYSPCTPIATDISSWGKIGIRNGGDVVQVRKPDGSFYHGFAYGTIDVSTVAPTFPISGNPSFNAGAGNGGSTFSFQCGDWEDSSNFIRSGAAGRTAGLANSADNQIFINKILNGTYDYTDLSNPLNCTLITIDTSSNPTSCLGTDGFIRLDGLITTTSYTVNYTDDATAVSATISSDASGLLTITGLNAGSYTNISVSSGGFTSNVLSGPIALVDPSGVVPVINSSDGDNIICAGDSVTFTASGGDEYEFSIGGVGIVQAQSTDATFDTTSLTTGQVVTVRVVNTTTGCDATSSGITTTVNALPVAAAITGASAVCLGDTITLTEGTAGTILWNSSAIGVATIASSGVVTPVATGTTDITYTVEDVNGCVSTASAIFTVTVNPLPVAAAITGASAVCLGDTITLTEGTAGTILWNSSAIGVATIASSGVVTPVATGTTDITYTVEDVNGCVSNTSAIFTVTVNPLPVAAAITGDTAVCLGDTITLTEGTAGTILWNSSDTGVATIDSSGIVTPVATGTTDITYTVEDVNGCVSTPSAAFTITVNPLPVATPITGDTAVCLGDTITLTEGTAGTIVWSSSDTGVATIDSSGVVTPVATGTTDITYTVEDVNGCVSTPSAAFTITVNPLLTPVITNDNGLALSCTIPTTTLTATGGGTYAWDTGATTPAITVTTAGTFTVTVTATNGCTNTATVTITQDLTTPTAEAGTDLGIITNTTLTLDGTGSTLADVDYEWTTGTGVIDSGETTLSPIVSEPGEYTLTVTNKTTGCTATDSVTITLSDSSNLALTKTGVYIDLNNNGTANPGDQITYTFTVENNGNIPLTNIVLIDPLPNIEVIGDPIDLLPGEINLNNFTAIYILQEEDILAGQVINQAMVIGQDPNGIDVIDLSDDPIDTTDIDLDSDDDFEDQTVITIEQSDEIIIHNVITPNGDGINDELRMPGLSLFPNNTLRIYNRWGVSVFEKVGTNNLVLLILKALVLLELL